MGNLLLPLLIVALVIPMFLGRRRQQKVMAETAAFQASLTTGERIMTTAGLHATVVDLDEDTVELEIAPGVITTWSRMVVKERVIDPAELDVEDEDESEISMSELDFVKHDAKEA